MDPFTVLPFLLLIAVILLGILWFSPVRVGTIFVTYWLGAFNRILKPGPHFVFWPFETRELISTATRQIELPVDQERIDRVNDNPLPGMVKPIRVTHMGYKQAFFYVKKGWLANPQGDPLFPEATSLDQLDRIQYNQLPLVIQEAIAIDPVNAPLTSEISVVMEWAIKSDDRKSVHNFVSNVATEEGLTRDEEIHKRANDLVTSVLQGYLSPVTLGHTKLMLRLFSKLIHEELEILVGEKPRPGSKKVDKPWGIHVGTAFIKDPYTGRTIAEAQANAAASVSRAQDTIRDSEAVAQATRNQGAAERDAEIDKGKGEAGRIQEMTHVMKDPNARFIAALDVAEQVLPKARIIITPGNKSVFGDVIALGQTILEESGENPPKAPTGAPRN